MFENHYISRGYTFNDIMECQEEVFNHFFFAPNQNNRYLSPFRPEDSSEGCRFDYSNGVWYFIDNATYRNQLRFNCVQFVMALDDINFTEAINKIAAEVDLSKCKKIIGKEFTSDIRIQYKKLSKNNLFTQKYDLPLDYLDNKKVKKVVNYWCNTRNKNYLRLNAIYNPREVDTYCYLLDHKELYFPEQEIKYYKTKVNKKYYGENDLTKDYVLLVEGNKDYMIIDYHYNINVLGLSTSHNILDIPQNIIFILLDPDSTGINNSIKLEEYYSSLGKKVINLTKLENKYDIADMYENNKNQLNKLINNITYDFG